MKIRLKKPTKVMANITFNRKQAMKFFKMEYYKAQAQDIKAYNFIQKEKKKLATPANEKISELISIYRDLSQDPSPLGKTLRGLFEKNKRCVQDGIIPINTNLTKILSMPETLILAYRAIKGNKGAMARGAIVDKEKINTFTDEQREIYFISKHFPDRFSLRDIFLIGRLIRKGLYPWGSSKRIYFLKPGTKNKLRPITIPPFMDRIVQKATGMILEAIYEPLFEKTNRSFGFRPNKGVHDAIVYATTKYSSGKVTAIEGDISDAYGSVNKEKLIEILTKRICDRKFINLLRNRLDYDFVEETDKGILRVRPPKGIPQGGIDSPYLFNIYMHEFDEYVLKDLQEYTDDLNKKYEKVTDPNTYSRRIPWNFSTLASKQNIVKKNMRIIKTKLKNSTETTDSQKLRQDLFKLIKKIKLIRHKRRNTSSNHPHGRIIKIMYIRYADDFCILTNANKQIAQTLKEKISKFLEEKLELRLSDEKTVITDITKTPAKFLGFELKHPKRGPIYKKPLEGEGSGHYKLYNVQRKSGTIIWASPDKQRLIDRLHMKGFCDKDGFPREIPWLAGYESHVIIERFNATIRGLSEYYIGFVRNTSSLSRWIYILRFSCLKTLAQKYRTSISKIFKRFGINQTSLQRKTIQIPVQITVGKNKLYQKEWKLLTYWDIKKLVEKKNLERRKKLEKSFYSREKEGIIGEYPTPKGRIPTVTNDDYLKTITWVSMRTQAALDMPCANCLQFGDVHQHHIKAIRKNAYELIPTEMTYKKIMALRNRKQIPLCQNCHINLVHKGAYSGKALIHLATRLGDNRIVHVESFIHPGEIPDPKPLEMKGWKLISEKLIPEHKNNTSLLKKKNK